MSMPISAISTAATTQSTPGKGMGDAIRLELLVDALVEPGNVRFGRFEPAQLREVLNDPSLTIEDKREVLRRWAWDAWLLEVAADEAMAAGEPSRYDEVKAA